MTWLTEAIGTRPMFQFRLSGNRAVFCYFAELNLWAKKFCFAFCGKKQILHHTTKCKSRKAVSIATDTKRCPQAFLVFCNSTFFFIIFHRSFLWMRELFQTVEVCFRTNTVSKSNAAGFCRLKQRQEVVLARKFGAGEEPCASLTRTRTYERVRFFLSIPFVHWSTGKT